MDGLNQCNDKVKFVGRKKRKEGRKRKREMGREDHPLLPFEVLKVKTVIFYLRTPLAMFIACR